MDAACIRTTSQASPSHHVRLASLILHTTRSAIAITPTRKQLALSSHYSLISRFIGSRYHLYLILTVTHVHLSAQREGYEAYWRIGGLLYIRSLSFYLCLLQLERHGWRILSGYQGRQSDATRNTMSLAFLKAQNQIVFHRSRHR